MIIVLKPHTTEENITRVENLIKNRGLDTHVVRGTEMTIIGCIGDTTLIDPRLFEVDSSVDKVMHVQEPYKLANRAFHPEDSVIDVSGVKIGGGHMGLIRLPKQPKLPAPISCAAAHSSRGQVPILSRVSVWKGWISSAK